MLATYKIVKSVNLPDQVGVNAKGKILMLNCEKNDDARPGNVLASYRGDLAEKYKLEVAILVQDLDKFLVLVRDSETSQRYWDDDYEEDEDDDEYREEADEIFCEEADDKELLNVLGEAFAFVEKELTPKKMPEVGEKKPECPKEKSLKELKKLLDALYDDDE